MRKLLFILLFSQFFVANAQNVTIIPSGITPAANSSYSRLTYDAILALPNPQIGDLVYDLTFRCLRHYNGQKWECTHNTPEATNANISLFSASENSGNYVYNTGVVTDIKGNVFITGYFIGTATFGNITKTSTRFEDVFVMKYNSSGIFQWVQVAGGNNYDYSYDIAVDTSSNVYITGKYSSTITFNTISRTSSGNSDIFMAKYNKDGVVQWVQSIGSSYIDSGNAIAVDTVGNVYLTGTYSGTVLFGSSFKNSVSGSQDVFTAKYNTSGSLQWVQSVGGGNDDGVSNICVDKSGNVGIIGSFSGTSTFGLYNRTSAGENDIFVVKYNNSGVFQWVHSHGGTTNDFGTDIIADNDGNIYATGTYSGSATFSSLFKTSAGSSDIFITKYNSTGTIQWVQSAGGIHNDTGDAITIAGNGDACISGKYSSTAIFGNVSLSDSRKLFIARYNPSGELKSVQAAVGPSASPKAITADINGSIYIAGSYSGAGSFGNISRPSSGSSDGFCIILDK